MSDVVDYLGIKIDLHRDQELTEQAMSLLKDYYMTDSELYAQQAFARAAVAYCEGDYAFAQRIYDYASKRWFMFALRYCLMHQETRRHQGSSYLLFSHLCW
jgi:ribonucleotide reductase alpha subunit